MTTTWKSADGLWIISGLVKEQSTSPSHIHSTIFVPCMDSLSSLAASFFLPLFVGAVRPPRLLSFPPFSTPFSPSSSLPFFLSLLFSPSLSFPFLLPSLLPFPPPFPPSLSFPFLLLPSLLSFPPLFSPSLSFPFLLLLSSSPLPPGPPAPPPPHPPPPSFLPFSSFLFPFPLLFLPPAPPFSTPHTAPRPGAGPVVMERRAQAIELNYTQI